MPYLVTLTRVQAPEVEVWPIALPDPLPIIAVPLRPPDADVPLDLASALHDIYDEAFYNLSINYREPPPKPGLPEGDQTWVETLLGSFQAEG